LIVICFAQVFTFASNYGSATVLSWGWITLFAVLSDLMVVDGVFIMLVTLLTLTVGSAPDACGKCRNCFLNCVPQAIKDAAE